MTLYWGVLFFIISHHQVLPSPIFNDLTFIAQFASDTSTQFEEIYNIYESQNTTAVEASLDNVYKEVTKILSKIEEMGVKRAPNKYQELELHLQRLYILADFNANELDLYSTITDITSLFQSFLRFLEDHHHRNGVTIGWFINLMLDEVSGLEHLLTKFEQLIITERTSLADDSIFAIISNQTEPTVNKMCGTVSTPQLQIFQLYIMMIKTHIESFIMMSFANLMRQVLHKGSPNITSVSFSEELKKAERRVIKGAREAMTTTKARMKQAPRDLRSCDPPVYKRGENFLEFRGFMEGVVKNEVELNLDHTCGYTCETQPKPVRDNVYEDSSYRLINSYCYGQLVDCRSGGEGEWSYCPIHEPGRRTAYIVDGNEVMYGTNKTCTENVTRRESLSAGVYRCDFCMCICVQDQGPIFASRVISLRPQIADIENNKVVTGVRFVGTNGIMHIQIREGVLQLDGTIERDSESWKELEKFDLKSSHEKEPPEYIIGRDNKTNYGRDFTVLKYDQRQMNLDDLFAPINHVVTGIKFQHPRIPKETENQPIEIAIHVTPLDFSSGTLEPTSKGIWITPSSHGNRTKLNLKNCGNPIDSRENRYISPPNSSIEIQASDWYEDLAESTIPFLDGQPVSSNPAFPLGGVGLAHKGTFGSGGFLILKIFSLDLPEYINEEVLEESILS